MLKVGLLANLVAKPGKEEEVAALLSNALKLAEAEPATVTWYALRLGPREFGVFDTFRDDDGRKAHLGGPIAQALMARADELLSEPPRISPLDLLAVKGTQTT
jgi:quinol monooxygenase YgiN